MLQEILLVNPRGFCAGVNYAINIVDKTYELYRNTHNIFILKEIVHNKLIVEEYESKNIKSVQSIEEIPENSIIVFSAHGVPPEYFEIAKQRNLKIIDATCPLVKKVHMEAQRYAQQGYYILYIGHRGHEEAIGVMAECPDSITLIHDKSDIENITVPQTDKLIYLTQTTLSLDETAEIIEILQERYPNIQSPPKEDICYATTNRQVAVKELAQQVDLVLVIGSQNSSNSQRLKESSIKLGTQAYLIDSYEQIETGWLENINSVGITAGASAPEKLVQELITYIQSLHPSIQVRDLDIIDERTVFKIPEL